MDQIDCYQNVGTKLTMTPNYIDQNGIFPLFLSFQRFQEVFWRFEDILVTLKGCGGIFGDLRGYFSHFLDFGFLKIFLAIWRLDGYFGYCKRVFVILQILGGIFVIIEFFQVVRGEGEYFDHLGNFIDVLFTSEDLEYFCHLKISRGIFVILEILSYFDQF